MRKVADGPSAVIKRDGREFGLWSEIREHEGEYCLVEFKVIGNLNDLQEFISGTNLAANPDVLKEFIGK